MAKFGPYTIEDSKISSAMDSIIKNRRNPGGFLRNLDKEAKKVGATNAQRRAAMRMLQNKFNSRVKEAKAGFDRASADIKAGDRGYLKKSLTSKQVDAAKKSFSGAIASLMDDMMNPEPSQEGKPYGGSKELKKATRKAMKVGKEAYDYGESRKKKAGGGKVYAMNRRTGGSIRKPRMK